MAWASRPLPADGHALPDHGRCRDRLLERQGAVAVLATHHRHPRGRNGRQPGDGGRHRVAATARHAAVSRPPVGLQLPDRIVHANAAGLLRHRSDGVRGHQHGHGRDRLTRASRTCLRRPSTRASTRGSISAPPASRERSWGRTSHATAHGTTSDRRAHDGANREPLTGAREHGSPTEYGKETPLHRLLRDRRDTSENALSRQVGILRCASNAWARMPRPPSPRKRARALLCRHARLGREAELRAASRETPARRPQRQPAISGWRRLHRSDSGSGRVSH